MESWPDDFFQMLETFTYEVEQFFNEVGKEVNQVIDAIVEASEDAIEQMQHTFSTEFEQQLTEFIDPLLEACLGIEGVAEETAQPFIHTIDPILSNQPACAGCRHYHGQMYGGNLLVCGMHPYGWEGEKCPDWQSTWNEDWE